MVEGSSVQPWVATLLACGVSTIVGMVSAFVAVKVLQARHDERLRALEKDNKRVGRNVHALREEIRDVLYRKIGVKLKRVDRDTGEEEEEDGNDS